MRAKVTSNIFTLNDKQRPGKDNDMNLRYSRANHTTPFLFALFCFFFQQLGGNMQEEWPD